MRFIGLRRVGVLLVLSVDRLNVCYLFVGVLIVLVFGVMRLSVWNVSFVLLTL